MSEIVIYEDAEGLKKVQVLLEGETVWLTQRQMSELFETTPENIIMHLKNIFAETELVEPATTKDFLVVQTEGKRQVSRTIKHYNLDAIISVGYRVNSRRSVRFRQWATSVLRGHILKGYSLNQARLAELGIMEAQQAVGKQYTPALREPYRWQDWAAPYSDKQDHPLTSEGKPFGWKRMELEAGKVGDFFAFINKELLPYLHQLDLLTDGRPNPSATPGQRVIGRIMTAVERTRVDSEINLRDILDLIHKIHIDHIDDRHFFTLSQVYEDLLLKMGEKNSDGGQFFTPRQDRRGGVCEVAYDDRQ